MPIHFAACSPAIICRYEIVIKPKTIANVSFVCGLVIENKEKKGLSITVKTGSPIQPRASEASVIPS